MPLVWAHAEYLKLVASRRLERPFDRPSSVWAGRRIDLTYRAGSNWIGRDFRVLVAPASPAG
jgi:hypothetical protein